MSDCNSKKKYQSLKWCKGKAILPGIRRQLHFISKDEIVKWPTLADEVKTGGSVADIVTYEGDFELAVDAVWHKMDIISNESPVDSEPQGEVPCVTSLNKATFQHPGTEEEATAFAKEANNDELIYAIQTRRGKWRIIGNEMFDTTTKTKQSLGGGVTDKAGTTIEVECTDVCPAPFYVGTLKTEDGEIDCSTGVVTP